MSDLEAGTIGITMGPMGADEARLAAPIAIEMASGEMIHLGFDAVFSFEDRRRGNPPTFDLALIVSADERLLGLSWQADFKRDGRGIAAIRAERTENLIARMLAGPPSLADHIEAYLSPEAALEAISEALFGTADWPSALPFLGTGHGRALEAWVQERRVPASVWVGLAKALERHADEIQMLAARARAFADRAR